MVAGKQMLNAKDIQELLEVSQSKAYGLIKQMNDELKASNHIVIRGKVPSAYIEKRFFGIHVNNGSGQEMEDGKKTDV